MTNFGLLQFLHYQQEDSGSQDILKLLVTCFGYLGAILICEILAVEREANVSLSEWEGMSYTSSHP